MKVNNIIYERSVGDSHNRQISRLEVQIGENENPDIVMDWMVARINSDLGIDVQKMEKNVEQLLKRKRELEREIESAEYQATQAKERWEKAKAFLAKYKMSLDSDDIPF